MLDPRRMWPLLAGLAVVTLAVGWLQRPVSDPNAEQTALMTVRDGATAKTVALTRKECLAQPNRLWVTIEDGVECIAYVATDPRPSGETAVVFFEGDVGEDDSGAEQQKAMIGSYRRRITEVQMRLGVPYFVIGRPGLMGSSGFHLLGGRRDEGYVMNAAVDALKQRYGVRRLALAGQSGGARVVAQLMALGRRDILCAVMGSGAYDVPSSSGGRSISTNIFGDPGRRYLVPMHNTGGIAQVPERRAFVLGDARDTRTPWTGQQAWAEKLRSLGHHAVVRETIGEGPDHHGVANPALLGAGLCATGKSDAEILAALAEFDKRRGGR